jgi:hypothetical protein
MHARGRHHLFRDGDRLRAVRLRVDTVCLAVVRARPLRPDDSAPSAARDQLADFHKRAELCADNFKKYVSHLARERWARDIRAELVRNLASDEAIITIDWAMKFLPIKAIATSKDWFGMRGISWHSASIITRSDPAR